MAKWEVLSQFCNVTSVLYFLHTNACRDITTKAGIGSLNLYPAVSTEKLWAKYNKNNQTQSWLVLGLYWGLVCNLKPETAPKGGSGSDGYFVREQKTWPDIFIMLENGVEALNLKGLWYLLKDWKNLPFSLGKYTETCCFLGVVTIRRKRHLKTWNSQFIYFIFQVNMSNLAFF